MSTKELIEFLTSLGYSVYPTPNFVPDLDNEFLFPCLFIVSNGGGSTDVDLPIQYPSFQIIVKGKNALIDPLQFEKTENVGQNLINLLDQKENFRIGNNTVYYCRSQMSSPISIGMDLKNRPTYTLNFDFKLQPALKGEN
ncbi:minor capsid protein [Chryseomicrobium palamuruense]